MSIVWDKLVNIPVANMLYIPDDVFMTIWGKWEGFGYQWFY